MDSDGTKQIARHKKAYHTYQILDKWEAGIELKGTEVKSLRNGQVQMVDSYARFEGDEVFLVSLHISAYDKTAYGNHEPTRRRKLLLHRREIRKIHSKVAERGLTLIPLRLYFRRGLAKVELGLCRGKQQHDKRQDIRKREHKRAMERAAAAARRG